MIFRYVCLLCCVFAMAACTEQKITPTQYMEQAQLIQTRPLTLKKQADVEKVVAIHVLKQGKKDVSAEMALLQSIKGAGFSGTQSPSQAGYVILVNIVYEGAMSQAQANEAAAGADAQWKPRGIAQSEDAGKGIVVDVHIATRKKASPVRNNAEVVSTASLETILDEASGRMVVFALDSKKLHDTTQGTQNLLLQRVGKAIAGIL